jgi:hypothetical protein
MQFQELQTHVHGMLQETHLCRELGFLSQETFHYNADPFSSQQNGVYLRVVVRTGDTDALLAGVYASLHKTDGYERTPISILAGSAACALARYYAYDPDVDAPAFPSILTRNDYVPHDSIVFDDMDGRGSGTKLLCRDIPLLTNSYNGEDHVLHSGTGFTAKSVTFTWTPQVLSGVTSGELELWVGVRENCHIDTPRRDAIFTAHLDGRFFRVTTNADEATYAVVESDVELLDVGDGCLHTVIGTPTVFAYLLRVPHAPIPSGCKLTLFSVERFCTIQQRFWCWADWGITENHLCHDDA